LPPCQHPWAREQAEILAAGLRDSKYHIVGDLAELLPPPAAGPYVSPASLPAEQLLDAAIVATAALADRQYRGDIVTSDSDLTVGMRPAGGQPRMRGSPWRMVSRLGWAILTRSQAKRLLYRASRRPAVRNLRVLVWRILTRPGRRAPGLPGQRRGTI
jgi:hypothetical protein